MRTEFTVPSVYSTTARSHTKLPVKLTAVLLSSCVVPSENTVMSAQSAELGLVTKLPWIVIVPVKPVTENSAVWRPSACP